LILSISWAFSFGYMHLYKMFFILTFLKSK
jgi:hypothetical protein